MRTHRASLGAVQRAVGDDLRQADDPVVDLVSASPLHYNTNTRQFNFISNIYLDQPDRSG